MAKTIAILTGGVSTERTIALESAASVQRAIGPHAKVILFDVPKQLDDFIARRREFDCVIPVFHGRGGEDGTIQGFLDTLDVSYIFSRVAAHALAMDKSMTKDIVHLAGLRGPRSTTLFRPQPIPFERTVVVKPVDGGSSVGVAIAHTQAELNQAITNSFTVASSVMVEDYIVGREFSVAVVDLGNRSVPLPVISISSAHEFFDYESKYSEGLAIETCPADISESLARQLQAAAVTAHRAIGARHVSRSDFIVDDQGDVWFLEINTIPGMSVLLPKALAAAGYDFGDVLMGWVDSVRR